MDRDPKKKREVIKKVIELILHMLCRTGVVPRKSLDGNMKCPSLSSLSSSTSVLTVPFVRISAFTMYCMEMLIAVLHVAAFQAMTVYCEEFCVDPIVIVVCWSADCPHVQLNFGPFASCDG